MNTTSSTNSATPIAVHNTWVGAAALKLKPLSTACCLSPMSRRWIITRPRPLSTTAIGSSNGSAYGATLRITRWVTMPMTIGTAA